MSQLEAIKGFPLRWGQSIVSGWDAFWFTPRLPHTLCVIRFLCGAMLLYSHLVLATDLMSFIGPDAWINNDMARQLHDGAFGDSDWARSYLWYIDSAAILWAHHGFTILVSAMFMVGCFTRFTAPLAALLQLMYIHRLTGALFGLDQIVTYTTIYLSLSPCGSRFSVDEWLRKKWSDKRAGSRFWRWMLPSATPSVGANIATRLLQLHICVIYLFGGLSKSRGEYWWDGSAVWFAIGNYEYQSLDVTFLSKYPALLSFLTNVTLFWEIFFCALVWPKKTRPIALGMVVAVHGGIAAILGMITFGLMMIFANVIFIESDWVARLVGDKALADSVSKPNEGPEDVDAASEKLNESGASIDELRQMKHRVKGGLAKLKRKKNRYRAFSAKLKRRHEKLKEREQRYKKRARRLRKREQKIKEIVERRRQRKAGESSLGDSSLGDIFLNDSSLGDSSIGDSNSSDSNKSNLGGDDSNNDGLGDSKT